MLIVVVVVIDAVDTADGFSSFVIVLVVVVIVVVVVLLFVATDYLWKLTKLTMKDGGLFTNQADWSHDYAL